MRFTRDFWPVRGQCFVVMPFGKKTLDNGTEIDWDVHYNLVIKPIVDDLRMTCIRADQIYGSGTTGLMDRIWRGIQEAEVIVADLTDRNPNVLYEVGLSHVIGKKIIITTMSGDDIPADLAAFKYIKYDTTGLGVLKLVRDLKNDLIAATNEVPAEMMLSPLAGAGLERVRAKVLSSTPEYATVETQDGRKGFLYAEDYSWVRRKVDLSRTLRVDQSLDGAFVFDSKGQQKYSLIAVNENPWPKLEQELKSGAPFKGLVKARPPLIGAFVGMPYDIDGLIPESQIPRSASLSPGDEIEATAVRIDPVAREVELRLVRKLEKIDRIAIKKGQQFDGSVVKVNFERGYALVSIADGATGLLPYTQMSPQNKPRFDDRSLAEGDSITVEVTYFDPVKNRLTLKDIGTTSTITG